MTASEEVRSFTIDFLEVLGCRTVPEGPVVWVDTPIGLGEELGRGPRFALTFDPDASGRLGAELVVPGSDVLERLLAAAERRGRWGRSRAIAPAAEWYPAALEAAGVKGLRDEDIREVSRQEEILVVFAFRLSLVSDEKRESIHMIVARADGSDAWAVGADVPSGTLEDAPGIVPTQGLEGPYDAAAKALRESVASEVASFRGQALGLLDEEIRRILRYYDRTLEDLRATRPSGLPDLLRAVEAERDRRLGEALERFEPRASARLTSVRVLGVPAVRLTLVPRSGPVHGLAVRIDAWTGHLTGARCTRCGDSTGPWIWDSEAGLGCLACAPTGGVSVRPRGRRPSGTPRRGSTVGRASARSPRGARGRPRPGAAPGRGP